MSHHHHEHHHHDHSHDHHTHGTPASLSDAEKLVKLLEHWVKHNDDHAENYKEWAKKAAESNMPDVGDLLNEVAEMTVEISRKFEEASELIKKK